jgi:hypothetical protein
MLKNFPTIFLSAILLLALNVSIYSQQCEVSVANITFESANSLTFDVYVENTGTTNFTYSNGSFVWTYDTSILNGGTPIFTLVPGFSDLPASAYPPSALINTPNILRTSSNMPGSNGIIQAGQSLRLYRFRLQTSTSSFASENFNINWVTDVTPSTKIYSWNNVSGLPEDITNLNFSIQSLFFTEDFDYTAGDALTDHGWTAHSGGTTNTILVTSPGLAYSGYQGSGIGNAATLTTSGQDVNQQFIPLTSGAIYAAVMVNITSAQTGDYFFHFGISNTTSIFLGRVFVKNASNGNLAFGLSKSSTNTTVVPVYSDSIYATGTTYLLILKYQFNPGTLDDSVYLFINPAINGFEPAPNLAHGTLTTGTDPANIGGIYLRQGSASLAASLTLDGIRIATAWSEIFPVTGTPLINVSPTSLSGFNYVAGSGPSASQSYNLSGSDLTPATGNITVTGSTNYEVSLNNSTFSTSVMKPYSGGNLSATPIYIRLKAGLAGGEYNNELITNAGGGALNQNVTCSGAVIKGEPTNHVTNFIAVLGNPSYYYNNLSWTDATGGTVPDGYLIKRSYTSFNDISDPIDGVPEDSSFEQNVAQGIQVAIFGGYAGSSYFYKIFPYTNSGSFINYKTDGSVPQYTITNTNAPSLTINENFQYTTGSLLTDDGWVAHSGAGQNPIMVSAGSLTYTGYINSGLGKSATLNGTGEDDNRAFDSVSVGSVYASFMVNISSATTSGVYFFHFAPENSFNYRARVYVQNDGSDNLAFGLSIGANSAVYTPFNYSINTTYLIVAKYTFNTSSTTDDEVKLWINPVLNGIEPTSDLIQSDPLQSDVSSLGSFALRQGTGGPVLTFGGLRVATTWVPQAGSNTFSMTLNVSSGWNMLSVPGTNPVGMTPLDWWSSLTGSVYKFVPGSGYQTITTTTPGLGYWEKNNGPSTYNYSALEIVTHNPIPAAAGWNMIGGFEDIVDVNSLVPSVGTIQYPIYQFNPGAGYGTATNITPGFGYWVKVSQNCTITIPDVLAKSRKVEVAEQLFKEDWSKITVTDADGSSYTLYGVSGEVNLDNYELPPLPPTGVFDVRFGSGRVAEAMSTSGQTIEMRGVVYPVTVSVEGMDIRLQDVTGSGMNTMLKSGESVTISDSRIDKLMVSGETIPTVYALEQNYPNPFNPSTVIEFSLPEDVSNAKLSVYNALGEKVAELVNSSLAAGRYSYQWNAKNVATGMYIYELRTEKFVSVKKMLLMK